MTLRDQSSVGPDCPLPTTQQQQLQQLPAVAQMLLCRRQIKFPDFLRRSGRRQAA